MIALLNLLPFLVTGVFLYIAARRRSYKWLVAAILFAILYGKFQPSYMPKGVVERKALPEFQQSVKAVEDRLLKPKAYEVYDEQRNRAIREIDDKLNKTVD